MKKETHGVNSVIIEGVVVKITQEESYTTARILAKAGEFNVRVPIGKEIFLPRMRVVGCLRPVAGTQEGCYISAEYTEKKVEA